MDDLLPMLQGMTGDGVLDGGLPTAEDGGIILSINGGTAWIKDQIKEHGFEEQLRPLYPILPFLVAFSIGYLTRGSLWEAAKSAAVYGTAATAAYRLHKDTTDHM